MSKKSKVVKVSGNGTWEGQYGLMYKFEIEMENGDIGENLSKTSECKFKEGQETDYEFVDGQFPKIKPVSTFQQSGGFKNNPDVQDNIRFAQSLNIANLQYCHGLISEEQIDEIADKFYNKLKQGRVEKLPFA